MSNKTYHLEHLLFVPRTFSNVFQRSIQFVCGGCNLYLFVYLDAFITDPMSYHLDFISLINHDVLLIHFDLENQIQAYFLLETNRVLASPLFEVFEKDYNIWQCTLTRHFVGHKLPSLVVKNIANITWESLGSLENGFLIFTFDSVDHATTILDRAPCHMLIDI